VVTAAMAVLTLTLLAPLLADLAEDLHAQGQLLWVAAPSDRPLAMLRHSAELLGRSDLQADTGRLGVRIFPTLTDAVAAYQAQVEPDHPST
jgi:hypothetical protein